jgi:hypothetical protein
LLKDTSSKLLNKIPSVAVIDESSKPILGPASTYNEKITIVNT